jgi:transposase
MARPKRYPEELIARGVRIALESDRPIAHIAADLGIGSETLRKRVRQAEADSGARPELLSSSEREEIRRLRKENYELRRAWRRAHAAGNMRSSRQRRYLVGVSGQASGGHGSCSAFELSFRSLRLASAASSGGTSWW